MNELIAQIQTALSGFSGGSLAASAKGLLNVLGYESERIFKLAPNNYKGFFEMFQTGQSKFDPDKARTKDWQSIDIIFQLTEDDIKKSHSLFEAKKVDNTIIESYLFFAVALTGEKYTRGDLVKITREINKLTPMPAMILFKYNNYLTVAVIDRRLHKRESTKDVLEKVTLIKDINIAKPHRAHIEILYDLSLDELQQKTDFANFVALHNAWRKTLDTSELNKKFFRELANWYFWALRNVEFPEDAEKNKDIRNAISVIRMITRLIFIWFVKEKGLIPDELFNQTKLKSLLNLTDKNQSTYYKAILQNLFFATLNTEMNKDKLGSRKFRGKNKGDGRDQHYMIHNVFRYEDYFTSSQDTLKKYFENIPFLNGGLFECLDKITASSGKDNIIRIDGFSDHPKNDLKVPDYLFFSSEQPVDLNEIYGTKNKTYKVRGLIDILDSYKFTVDENTPIEEEIALDPELLGKVFENLLASYNPETQTTARKQTGSFYTPREIVNYMVDESIIAYLSTKLMEKVPANGKDDKKLDERLRHLVAYNDQPHEFTPDEVDVLIAAINTLKALDPACGSGAFPMGMLHKLVYILGKLDPDNSKWRELQRQKAIKETEEAYKNEDKEEREKRLLDISEVFENNASDYGRKLYLIENCIFGVDIQPIAVQIAKLRFFVSLIVDQRIDPKKENLGVRPLPNLETKFVAANTLIGIEKPAQLLLRNPEIDKKEKELKEVRERHFTARTPQTKEKYRKADESLRTEISELLKKDGFPRETTEKLAKWNPYDQNASAEFFDPEWMFGITEGFDIAVGNPPYLKERDNAIYFAPVNNSVLGNKYHQGKMDYWYYFLHKSIDIAKENTGIIAFITPRYWLNSQGATKLIQRIRSELRFEEFIDIGKIDVFESVAGHHMISIFTKNTLKDSFLYKKLENDLTHINNLYDTDNIKIKFLYNSKIIRENNEIIVSDFKSFSDVSSLGDMFDVSQGVVEAPDKISKKQFIAVGRDDVSAGDGVFVLSGSELNNLQISNDVRMVAIKKYLDPNDVKRYSVKPNSDKYLIYSDKVVREQIQSNKAFEPLKNHLDHYADFITSSNGPYGLHRPREARYFDNDKILFKGMFVINEFTLDTDKYYVGLSFISIIKKADLPLKYLLSILNSKFALDWFYKNGKQRGAGVDIGVEKIRTFPVKIAKADEITILVRLVDTVMFLEGLLTKPKSGISMFIQRLIDAIIYELYLTEEVTESDANVLMHLGNLPVIQQLSDTKKMIETIEKTYIELNDTKHPVNMALFKMDTIDQIRIIEGNQ